MRYDAIVVGGSCAGAAAGSRLARAGAKTLIVEKASFPREKPCGGLITEKTVRALRDTYGGFPLDEIVEAAHGALSAHGPDSVKLTKWTHPTSRLYLVDRAKFDDYFLRKALSAGCDFRMGKVLWAGEGRVRLDSGEELPADLIIGADGAGSAVRRSVYPVQERRPGVLALRADIPLKDARCFDGEEEASPPPKVYFGLVKGGYAWVFPKKEYASVGVCGLARANPGGLRTSLESLLELIGAKRNAGLRITGSPLPFHNYDGRAGGRGVILVGDAAGFIEPVTGEGIYFAVLSGKLAAEAALEKGDAVANYLSKTDRLIRPLLRQAHLMRKFFYHPLGLRYALHKIRNNAKYAKYFLDVLAGETDYVGYIKAALMDRNVYPSE